MTDKQYPPLPEPRFSVRSIPSMRRGKERISCVDSFDAAQMRAYVDADRAQRACDAPSLASRVIELAEQIAFRSALAVKQHFEGEEISGTPESARLLKKQFIDAVHTLAALNKPNRPGTSAQGEKK